MKKELKLSSVKLVNNGLKGIIVSYAQVETRNNHSSFSEFPNVKKKFPIHPELECCFIWLKEYMLEICGYEKTETYLSNLTMTEVKYSDKGFILLGDLIIDSGILKLKTPLIQDEIGFHDFRKVCNILDGIYAETKEYLNGNKFLNDIQIVMKFNEGKKFDEKSFYNLPAEEQRKIAKELLNKQGKDIIIEIDDENEEVKIPSSEDFQVTNTIEEEIKDHFETEETTPTEDFSIEFEPEKIKLKK